MKKIILQILVILFAGVACSMQAQWILQNSPSQNYNLVEVFALDPNTAFAVGYDIVSYEGIIIKTTNGGDNWMNFLVDSTGYYLSIFFINQNIGWIAGGFPDPWSDADFGIIQKTTDGGENWIKDTIGVGALNSIIFVDQNTGWTAGIDAHFGPHGLIYKSTDGGVSWDFIYDSGGPLMSVFFIDNYKGWVIGGAPWEGSILKTTDGGNNWVTNSLSTFIPQSIYFINTNIGWATGHEYSTNFGLIYKTINGGENWISQSFGVNNRLTDVYFDDEYTGWTVGSGGIILKTIDGGNNWSNQESGTNSNLNSINFVNENAGWVVGENGIILKTTNGGGAVPVELTSFTATTQADSVELNWTTASEINNQGFEVQRSTVNSEFVSIGFVEGNGTTTEEHNYRFKVKDVSGFLRYRLKQIDFGGSFEYSDIIEVTVNPPLVFRLQQNYPNPFNPSTKIKYSLPQTSQVQIKVYDVLGNEIAVLVNEMKPAGTYELTWNASNLPSGVYFYQLRAAPVGGEAGNFNQTKKMILLR